MPELDTAAVRARLGAFLVAWQNRIGNDQDRIYNLDGGIEWDGGTSLLHSDIAALLAENERLREEREEILRAGEEWRRDAEAAEAALARVRDVVDGWERTADSLAITYQDAAARARVIGPTRARVAAIRAALDGAHPTPSDGSE